jgi:predicted transcriptional regulator
MKIQIPAKANNLDEQSDAIVVSFGAEWQQHLLAQDFSAVIRKRVPKSGSFRWLYFHLNSPVSAICARAQIVKIFNPTLKEIIAIANEINLTPDEIQSYAGGDSCIGCYRLEGFQFGTGPVSTAEVTKHLLYFPPQSFVILSKQAKEIIDRLAGFDTPRVTRTRKAGKI